MVRMILKDKKISYISISTFIEIFHKYLLDYNWLITDTECFCKIEDIETMFLKDYVWLSGTRLEALQNISGLSFSWAVFSGFKKEIMKEDILKYPLPYADGNTSLFENNTSLQNPLADIEIVVFDSSYIVIRSNLSEIQSELEERWKNLECF